MVVIVSQANFVLSVMFSSVFNVLPFEKYSSWTGKIFSLRRHWNKLISHKTIIVLK